MTQGVSFSKRDLFQDLYALIQASLSKQLWALWALLYAVILNTSLISNKPTKSNKLGTQKCTGLNVPFTDFSVSHLCDSFTKLPCNLQAVFLLRAENQQLTCSLLHDEEAQCSCLSKGELLSCSKSPAALQRDSQHASEGDFGCGDSYLNFTSFKKRTHYQSSHAQDRPHSAKQGCCSRGWQSVCLVSSSSSAALIALVLKTLHDFRHACNRLFVFITMSITLLANVLKLALARLQIEMDVW